MRFENEKIPIEQIDTEDGRYRISTDTGSENLIGSMRRLGLLNPPIVEEKNDGFAVISGFRRIDASLRIGLKRIPVRIVDKETRPEKRILFAVGDNSLQRPLNLIETSRALNLLSSHFRETEDLCRVCRDLRLPDRPEHVKKILRLHRLPVPLQTAVLEEAVSLSMALALEHLETKAAEILCELFLQLKIGFNIQQELITWVKEIAIRDNVSERQVLEDPAFLSIIEDRDLDRTQKRHVVRKYFKQKRYPALSHHEEVFEKHRTRLKIGPFMKFEPPPFFEGSSYTMTIRFSSLSELENRISTLTRLADDPAMKKILPDRNPEAVE